MLFHVEQTNIPAAWRYRVRFPDSPHAALRSWQRERLVSGELATAPLSDPNVAVEAEWRPEGDEEWQATVPHEFQDGVVAEFGVTIRKRRDFTADPILRCSALVRGQVATFDLSMPPRVLGAHGEEFLRVQGRSYHFGPGHHLRAYCEFRCGDEVFSVLNLAAGQAALLPVPVAMPGASPPRDICFVSAGKISAREISDLLSKLPSHAC